MRELLDDRPDWFDDEHTGMTPSTMKSRLWTWPL